MKGQFRPCGALPGFGEWEGLLSGVFFQYLSTSSPMGWRHYPGIVTPAVCGEEQGPFYDGKLGSVWDGGERVLVSHQEEDG